MQLQTLFTSHIQTYMNSTDKTQVINSITKVRGFVEEHMQDFHMQDFDMQNLKILLHYNLISDIQEQVLVACCSATGIKQLNYMLSMLFKVCDNLKDVTAVNELKDGLDFKTLALLSSVCVIYCQEVENVCQSELETYSKDEKARTSSNDTKQMSLTPLVTDLIHGHIGLCDCAVTILMCLLRLEEKNSESSQWRSSLIKLRAARLKSFVSEIRYVGSNEKRGSVYCNCIYFNSLLSVYVLNFFHYGKNYLKSSLATSFCGNIFVNGYTKYTDFKFGLSV